MFGEISRISRPSIESGRRVIVVSDIHGNLPYFRGLLEKVSYTPEDILIIDGDFLEKGTDSLGTLRYIMERSRSGAVYTVLGNCDEWQLVIIQGKVSDEHISRYFHRKRTGLLFEMLQTVGIDPLITEHPMTEIRKLKDRYEEEFRFLEGLPHALEAEQFIFCHAGMDGTKALEKNCSDELNARKAFLKERQSFKKWVVTGHWPCVLYGEKTVNANPIIDREHHVVTLDGGCVLKDDGQLNALILPEIDCTDPDLFQTAYYDHFPTATVLDNQRESSCSYYIRWGDRQVEVLEKGAEFSHCRHVRTGYEMDILTRYLFTDKDVTECNDCTDYVLPVRHGDTVGIVETTSRGYFVKHRGISGWYFGKLALSNG